MGSDCWPTHLILPIHGDHQLTKTNRTAYTCDGCRELGANWSFYCEICDFDLHPDCALEAQLLELARPWPQRIKHPFHEHELVKTLVVKKGYYHVPEGKSAIESFIQLQPNHEQFCGDCAEKILSWCLHCKSCNSGFHLECALSRSQVIIQERRQMRQMPSTVSGLTLKKIAKGVYWCAGCGDPGMSWSYHCEQYDVDIHPDCVLSLQDANGWPASVAHRLHTEHELVGARKDKRYVCKECWEMGYGYSFSCGKCEFYLHPKCANESLSRSTVETGWSSDVLRERRKEAAMKANQPGGGVSEAAASNILWLRHCGHMNAIRNMR